MMDRLNRFAAQVYGYAVCLIAVITLLISIKNVIDSLFDLRFPLRAQGGSYGRTGRSLSSFELYKLDGRRNFPRDGRASGEPQVVGATTPLPVSQRDTITTEAELRHQYDAERAEHIGNATFRALRELVGSVLLAVFASVLFWAHWRWLRRITNAGSTA